MTASRNLICAASALALSACGTLSSSTPTTQSKASEPGVETRVFFGPCVRPDPKRADESATFGTIFGAAIISNTLDRLGKAIRKAGAAEPYSASAFKNLEVEPGTVKPCVQIVRARFAAKSTTGEEPKQSGLSEALVQAFVEANNIAANADVKAATSLLLNNNLNQAGIHLASKPDFFFEGLIRSSENRSALSLVPSFYEYHAPLKPGRRADQAYAVLISVSFHPPGKAADAKEATGTSIALGALRPGADVHRVYRLADESNPSEMESPWFPTFAKTAAKASATPTQPSADAPKPSTGDVASATETVPADPPPTGATNTNSATTIPIILTASVTETRKANEVLLFFADVFDGSKENLKKEAEQAFIPSIGDAAALADYTSEQTKISSYYEKFAAAEAARVAVCTLSSDASSTGSARLTAASKLFSAQSSANVAALAANMPTPYPTMVTVTEDRLDCGSP